MLGGVWELGEGGVYPRRKNIMTENELLQNMLNCSYSFSQNENGKSIGQALQQSGIQPDASYYQGALKCIEQALKKKGDPKAVHFWEEYQFSLCKQLQHMQTNAGRETVQTAVKIVKAILCAMKD